MAACPPTRAIEENDVQINCQNSSNWVKLNVGGELFLTTKTTLCKEPNGFLCRLCREDPDLSSDKVFDFYIRIKDPCHGPRSGIGYPPSATLSRNKFLQGTPAIGLCIDQTKLLQSVKGNLKTVNFHTSRLELRSKLGKTKAWPRVTGVLTILVYGGVRTEGQIQTPK